MTGKFRGFDADIGWIKRKFADLERQIRESNAAKRAQATTIGEGGITVKDGGVIKTEYPSGSTGSYIGPGFTGQSDQMVSLADENGYAVFTVFRIPVGGAIPAQSYFSTAATSDLFSENAASLFHIDNNKITLFGATDGVQIGHTTTGSSANTFIDSTTGRIYRSTSSRRYKQDVEDAEVDAAAVLQMQPRTWRDKAEVEEDPDTDRRYVGFIAEELHDLGLGQFVVYDDEGEPEAISYDRLVAAVIPVLKDLDARVKALEDG